MTTVIRHAFNGRKFNPGVNPPDIVDTPWNSLCLQLAGTGDTSIHGKDIAPVLCKQAGFGALAPPLDFRVQKIRCWCLNAKRPLRMLVYGWDNTNTSQGGALVALDDFPSNVSFAAVGYELPRAVQTIVYSSDSDAKIFEVDVGSSYAWLAYVDVLWRGNTYQSITSTVRSRARDVATVVDLSLIHI